MRFVMAGSSGFLGTALRIRLAADGHEVVRLVRSEPATASESRWDPDAGLVDHDVIGSADVVVNLAGANVGRWPWTQTYRDKILQSRLATTGTLAEAIAARGTHPAWLNGSGMSYYGDDRGSEWLPETSSKSDGFLADVVEQWEAATTPAQEAGSRVCLLRSCVVLDRAAGALKLMRIPFGFGAGARLGSGEQYFSCISLDDWVSAVVFLAESPDAHGPYNLGIPDPPDNAEFTRVLADCLHRPAFLAVPVLPIKLVLGGLADELLGSLRVRPQRLLDAGFTFEHPDVTSVVAAGLH